MDLQNLTNPVSNSKDASDEVSPLSCCLEELVHESTKVQANQFSELLQQRVRSAQM